MQTSVRYDPPQGFEGQLITSVHCVIRGASEGYYAGEFLPYGRAAVVDPADAEGRRIILRNNGSQGLAGITLKNEMHGIEESKLLDPENSEFGTPEGEPIGLLTIGDILVYSTVPVARGDNPNSIITAGTGEDRLGRFTVSASPVFEGLVFADTITEPGLVRVSLFGNQSRF